MLQYVWRFTVDRSLMTDHVHREAVLLKDISTVSSAPNV